MSTDAIPSVGPRQQNSMRSALVSTIITVVAFGVFYQSGGRDYVGRLASPVTSDLIGNEANGTPVPVQTISHESAVPLIFPINGPPSNGEFAEVLTAGQNALSEFEQMTEYTKTWQFDFDLLMADERGRKIASDRSDVLRYVRIAAEDLPNFRDALAWTFEFYQVFRPIRAAQENENLSYEIRPEDRTYFENTIARISHLNEKLAARESAIKALIADVSGKPASERTLQEVMDQMLTEVEQAEEADNDSVSQEAEVPSGSQTQQLEIVGPDVTRVDLDPMATLARETAAEIANAFAVEEAKIPEAQRNVLESEFDKDQAEISSLLAPFLGLGEQQPKPGNPSQSDEWMEPCEPLAPMSLSRLQSSGALDATDQGLQRLYYLGGSPKNLRTRVCFPEFSTNGLSNGIVQSRVRRAQELLNKYGQLMVERRVLAQ